MQYPDTPDATGVMPDPGELAEVAATYFQDTAPGGGTTVSAQYLNIHMMEIVNLLGYCGQTIPLSPAVPTDTQLRDAVGGASAVKNDGGTGDTGVVTTARVRAVVASSSSRTTGINGAVLASTGALASGAQSSALSSEDTTSSGNFSTCIAAGPAGASNSLASGTRAAVIASQQGTASGTNAAVIASGPAGATASIASGNQCAVIASQHGVANTGLSVVAASTDGYATGINQVVLASLNANLETNYAIGWGYDAGATVAPGAVNRALTGIIHTDTGNSYFGGTLKVGTDPDAEATCGVSLGVGGAIDASTITAQSDITSTAGTVSGLLADFPDYDCDSGTTTAVGNPNGTATINRSAGTVTSPALTTAAGGVWNCVLTCTSCASTSQVMATLSYSGTVVTNGIPVLVNVTPANESITFNVVNVHGANALNGTVAISYFIVNPA